MNDYSVRIAEVAAQGRQKYDENDEGKKRE